MKTSLAPTHDAVALETVPEVAEYLTSNLRASGIDVGIHKAVTTNSVYLTFDHGLLRACRVGDHSGKGYKYRYEIGSHYLIATSPQFKFEGKWYQRYLYPSSSVAQLVADVIDERRKLQSKYGKLWYLRKIQELKSNEREVT